MELKEDIARKLKSVRMIVTDVDGVLTDGKIIFDDQGVESKQFNVKDGLIMKYIRRSGLITGVITGRDSNVVRMRCNGLHYDFHYHGIMNKQEVLEKELKARGLEWENVIYLGDDINDLVILKLAGLGVCPSDAPLYIQEHADLITRAAGGEGVFREVADMILLSRGEMDGIIEENS